MVRYHTRTNFNNYRYSKDVLSLTDKFLKIESEYNLLEREYKGFKYWRYIRFYVHRMCEEELGLIDAQPSIKYTPKKSMLLKMIINHSLLLRRRQVDVLVRAHTRLVMNDVGNYECKYVGEIIRNLDSKCIVSADYKQEIPENLEYDDICTIADVLVLTKLHKKMFPEKKLKDLLRAEVAEVIGALNQVYGIHLSADSILSMIWASYHSYIVSCWYYRKVLKRLRPKLILEVVGYGHTNMVLNELSKELHIPTIELQHGVMGRDYIAYNYSEKGNISTFPDKIFTYSAFWNETSRMPISEENAIAVGFPYLENLAMNNQREYTSSTLNIVFISQWTIGKALSEFAIDLYEYLLNQTSLEFKIIYKAHPLDNLWESESYEKLRGYADKIQIIDKEKNMYECLAEADVQIGVNSTGLYEGLMFNLITFIPDITGKERMQTLVDTGYAKYIFCPKEIADELINRTSKGSSFLSNFWERGAIEKAVTRLEKILDIE